MPVLDPTIHDRFEYLKAISFLFRTDSPYTSNMVMSILQENISQGRLPYDQFLIKINAIFDELIEENRLVYFDGDYYRFK